MHGESQDKGEVKESARAGDFVVDAARLKAVQPEDLEKARAALDARRRQFSDEVSVETLRFVVG